MFQGHWHLKELREEPVLTCLRGRHGAAGWRPVTALWLQEAGSGDMASGAAVTWASQDHTQNEAEPPRHRQSGKRQNLLCPLPTQGFPPSLPPEHPRHAA